MPVTYEQLRAGLETINKLMNIVTSQEGLSLEGLSFKTRRQVTLVGEERVEVVADMRVALRGLEHSETVKKLVEDVRKAGFNVSFRSAAVELTASFHWQGTPPEKEQTG
ncbi:MAG: hypothetical protein DRO12_05860 [Thermoprotei archaeon]|nr:MAG: hypothetical protein DRO12_05860 [Thermoprotei archaeon]